VRHRVYGKHLGRDKDTRETLFKGLVQALLTHGTIQTSEAKAKAIKGLIDKVINSAKNKQVFRFGLTKEILPKLGSRTSGYTSVVKMGRRLGDQTMMVKLSLIGAEEIKPIVKDTITKKQETSKKQVKTEVKKVATPKKEVIKKPVAKKKVQNKK